MCCFSAKHAAKTGWLVGSESG